MSINKSKIVAGAVGFSLALSAFVAVGAATASAQTLTLSDVVKLLVSLGIPADKAATAVSAINAAPAAVSFTKNLTIGSTGAEVKALQAVVGVTPATGYFGKVTAAAVKAYQTSKGISATGYVGALTRAALNRSAAPVAGTTVAPVVTTTVSQNGVEGTLTVNKASVNDSTVYEGDTAKPILGLKLEAKLSDINIQRVKLNLGQSTSFYTKVFKSISLVDDAGNVLVKADLNSNTVVKDNGTYYLTLGGFNYTVPKDSTKYLWVKADAYGSIDSQYRNSQTITVGDSGVRGTDGAGIDQYAPSGSTIVQNLSISNSLLNSASLDLSVDSANFKSTEVVATTGSNNNQIDALPVLAFDLRANKDSVTVTDLAIAITSGAANVSNVGLYDGSTLISKESPDNMGVAKFTNIDNLVIAKDATKVLTVKVDVINAATSSVAIAATASSTSVSAQNSVGDSATVGGIAAGENQIVRSVGPVFALNSKSISVSGTNNSGTTLSTSTVSAVFSVTVTAKGGDIYFANQASSSNKMFKFALYDASGAPAAAGVATTSEGFTIPSSGVTTNGTTGFMLSKNNSVTIDGVKVDVSGKNLGTGSPILGTAVGIDAIQWSTAAGIAPNVSNFMSGKTEWRTNTQNP